MSSLVKAYASMPFLETKRAALDIGKVDAEGVFEGYASLFGVLDLGGDMVMPGAFGDGLRILGANGVKMLWQHDPAQLLGVWTSIIEDSRGLKVRGKLNLNVARAREALALMRDGAIDGLSIGYRTRRAVKDAKSGVRRLYALDLIEISLVTFPMLPQARVESVKQDARTRWNKAASALQVQLARC
jgi:HK97 family phage prohead protease